MKYDTQKHRRRSIRLPGYDYARRGRYFVTICICDKENLFGKISNGLMEMNEYGRIAHEEWLKTEELRSNLRLDRFVVMPNHIHGIVIITSHTNSKGKNDICRGAARCAPTGEPSGKPTAGSLSAIVRAFKSAVTKRINDMRRTPGAPLWQRNYYEHIIRNDGELNGTRKYVNDNPKNWEQDEENPNMHNHYTPA
jgi:putative transposase